MSPFCAKNAELIRFDRHLKKTAPFFELCLPQSSVRRGESLQRATAGWSRMDHPMDGVMTEGYRLPFWEDGPRALVCGFWASESCLHGLKRAPSAVLDKPLSHAVFISAAWGAGRDRRRGQRAANLRSESAGHTVNDVTTSSVGSLLSALRYPDQAIQLFVDHVLPAAGL